MWCVIVFKEDDTVGLIRQECNTPGEERRKYPPCTKRELIQKWMKTSTPLQEVEQWSTQAIIIKREAIESWPEALKVERMIADDSEGVSTDYEQLGWGHKVVKKRQMSDFDEENDHVMSTYVKPTRQPTAKRSALDFANLEWPSCDVDQSSGRYKIPSPLATSTQFVETECQKKSSLLNPSVNLFQTKPTLIKDRDCQPHQFKVASLYHMPRLFFLFSPFYFIFNCFRIIELQAKLVRRV